MIFRKLVILNEKTKRVERKNQVLIETKLEFIVKGALRSNLLPNKTCQIELYFFFFFNFWG